MIIKCKNCGKEYDTEELEECNALSNAIAVLCDVCGEHLADVNEGKVKGD